MEFRKFDNESYAATLAKWRQEAESYECFPDEVDRKLKWIDESLKASSLGGRNQVIAYGVFNADQKIAAATCELVLSDKGTLTGKWLKLLKVTLSPEIEALVDEKSFEATTVAVQAYKAATLGAYQARLEHEADTLKLFGRNDDLLKFQMALMSFLQTDGENHPIKATRDGRWLVLKSEEKSGALL